MATDADPVREFGVLFGRAFAVTFAAMMVLDLLLGGVFAAFLGAKISLAAAAPRAPEVGLAVGVGYAVLKMTKLAPKASEEAGAEDVAAAAADEGADGGAGDVAAAMADEGAEESKAA
jgi:hypothetical protein